MMSRAASLSAIGLASLTLSSLALGGCLLSPTDDGRVTSTTAPLPFNGYLLEARAPAYVRAWNHTTHQMEDVGAPVLSGDLGYSVEGGQEFLFHRVRKVGVPQAIQEFDALDALAVWHSFDVDVLRESRTLVARDLARGRDAVHAATALAAGFDRIVSCDADFDGIPGLRRLHPADV